MPKLYLKLRQYDDPKVFCLEFGLLIAYWLIGIQRFAKKNKFTETDNIHRSFLSFRVKLNSITIRKTRNYLTINH